MPRAERLDNLVLRYKRLPHYCTEFADPCCGNTVVIVINNPFLVAENTPRVRDHALTIASQFEIYYDLSHISTAALLPPAGWQENAIAHRLLWSQCLAAVRTEARAY